MKMEQARITELSPDDYDVTQPEPSALVESLRAFGYSLRTAVADLIDNCISASARNVWIRFEWGGAHSFISIRDDGRGMTDSELVAAMRPGSRSPLEERSPSDLGRFGLGLKTASFSQCRRLSVMSKTKDAACIARCWDLDYINTAGEWRLLKKVNQHRLTEAGEEIAQQGTIVLWEQMDRVTGSASTDDKNAYNRFLQAIEEVKQHLAMVFHRYLEKKSGINIFINGRKVEAWDPFLRREKATQELPSEKLFCKGAPLTVTPYVLPHQSKLTQDTHRAAAGPQGWNAQQGFYIYRNERLLVPGDWLGLGFQKEEHHKLARIQIDLPNSMDDEWQIDVKKSRARPPGYLREDLKRIAKLTRDQAVQIYRHRGKVIARRSSQDHVFLWQQKTRHGKYFYEINRDHPLIQSSLREIGADKIEPILRLLEETIPASHIIITSSEEPDRMSSPLEGSKYADAKPLLQKIYSSFKKNGFSRDEIFDRLATMEPFNQKLEFIEAFREEPEGAI